MKTRYSKSISEAYVSMYEAKMSSAQIAKLKKMYEPMRDKRISPANATKLSKIIDMVGRDKEALIQLFKADIPFVSQGAVTKLITKHNMKGAEINKLKEEFNVESLQEGLDNADASVVKKVVKKLKGASDAHAGQAKDLEKAVKEETITSKDLLDNKFKEEKNGAQHFSKIEEDNYVWNFVYDDFGRTKLTTEPDKATHLVYTMEGKENPQLLKISEKEILDYKKGENYELSKKKEK